jgi:hypothetical protein
MSVKPTKPRKFRLHPIKGLISLGRLALAVLAFIGLFVSLIGGFAAVVLMFFTLALCFVLMAFTVAAGLIIAGAVLALVIGPLVVTAIASLLVRGNLRWAASFAAFVVGTPPVQWTATGVAGTVESVIGAMEQIMDGLENGFDTLEDRVLDPLLDFGRNQFCQAMTA